MLPLIGTIQEPGRKAIILAEVLRARRQSGASRVGGLALRPVSELLANKARIG
jgi:hypothetical protein